MKKNLLFFFALCAVHISDATVYAVDVLKKGNKTVYLFSDIHVPTMQEAQQKIDVIHWAKELGAALIIEDSSDMNCLIKELPEILTEEQQKLFKDNFEKIKDMNKQHLQILNGWDPFLFLTERANEADVRCVNAQFRPFMDLSGLSMGFIKCFLSFVLWNIGGYGTAETIEKNLQAMFESLPIDGTVESLNPEQSCCLERITCDLIDVRLLQAINKLDSRNVFVCAGAAHIDWVAQYLVRDGWQYVHNEFSDFKNRWDQQVNDIELSLSNSRLLEQEEAELLDIAREAAENISPPINIDQFFKNIFPSWKKWIYRACGIVGVSALAYVAYKYNVGAWLKQRSAYVHRYVRALILPQSM